LTPAALILAAVLLWFMAAIVSDRLRVDVAALVALLALVLAQRLPGVGPILDEERLFRGFASAAVVALISVMIISAALTRSGLLQRLADALLRISGTPERGAGLLLGGFGLLSAGVQNAGATAMAIPVARRYASRTGLKENTLLIPVGFMVLLGGSTTLIGNSAMLLVNDLLPADRAPLPWWAPAPAGLALLLLGLVYTGWQLRRVLSQRRPPRDGALFREVYSLQGEIRLVRFRPADGQACTVAELEERSGLTLVGLYRDDDLIIAPPRHRRIHPGSCLALVGSPAELDRRLDGHRELITPAHCPPLARAVSRDRAGVVELVIPPGSGWVGRSMRDIRLRYRHGLTPLALYRDDGLLQGDVRGHPLRVGDTVLAYMQWLDLDHLPALENAVLISPVPPRPAPAGSGRRALLVLAATAAAGLLLQPALPTLMLGCALLMVLTGVLDMDDAYRAVSWQTVFMIVALFPISDAMIATGISSALSQAAVSLLGPAPPLALLMLLCAVTTTLLALMVANVATLFILAPVAVQLAESYGHDPALLVLLTAVCTANTFLLPNNQVTSLIAAAGSFHSHDFIRQGALLQLLFIAAVVAVFLGGQSLGWMG